MRIKVSGTRACKHDLQKSTDKSASSVPWQARFCHDVDNFTPSFFRLIHLTHHSLGRWEWKGVGCEGASSFCLSPSCRLKSRTEEQTSASPPLVPSQMKRTEESGQGSPSHYSSPSRASGCPLTPPQTRTCGITASVSSGGGFRYVTRNIKIFTYNVHGNTSFNDCAYFSQLSGF